MNVRLVISVESLVFTLLILSNTVVNNVQVCVCAAKDKRQEQSDTLRGRAENTAVEAKHLNTEVKGQVCESHGCNQETEKWYHQSSRFLLHSRAELKL